MFVFFRMSGISVYIFITYLGSEGLNLGLEFRFFILKFIIVFSFVVLDELLNFLNFFFFI